MLQFVLYRYPFMKTFRLILGLFFQVLVLHSQCPEGLIADEQNLIRNGDFEADTLSFQTDYIYHNQADAGRYRIVEDAKEFWSHFLGKGNGRFLAVDGSAGMNKRVWQQQIDVQPNTTYFFSAWAVNLYTIPAVLQFSINGQLLDKPFHTSDQRERWEQFFVNWYSADQTKATITIVSQNPGMHGNDFGLDRIKFYPCIATSLPKKLEKTEIGTVIVLRNVLFETASAKILPASSTELNQLVSYLQQNPSVEIEIAGHTDSIGTDRYNLTLSQNRANAIGKYLTEQAIKPDRLLMKGYGKLFPIDTNETVEGRQKNRRVEFKITRK